MFTSFPHWQAFPHQTFHREFKVFLLCHSRVRGRQIGPPTICFVSLEEKRASNLRRTEIKYNPKAKPFRLVFSHKSWNPPPFVDGMGAHRRGALRGILLFAFLQILHHLMQHCLHCRRKQLKSFQFQYKNSGVRAYSMSIWGKK